MGKSRWPYANGVIAAVFLSSTTLSMPAVSFVSVPKDSPFPLQNLPFGVFSTQNSAARIGVALGDHIIDLSALATETTFFDDLPFNAAKIFSQDALNDFMALGKPSWKATRVTLLHVFDAQTPELRDHPQLLAKILVSRADAKMHMPARVGDYTDFYASKEHATNVGIMFRGKDNALMPNWVHLPVGYHGRASSMVVSGTPLHRPCGQRKPPTAAVPTFGPSLRLDFELEMAFFVGPGNALGHPISMHEAEDHIFGMVLMNDWSARDIQAWEYVPLGPFLGKNFGTTISPWVVTMEALEQARCDAPVQEPAPLPYLRDNAGTYDIALQVDIKTNKGQATVSRSNLKWMYWTLKQQLVHHTVSGCNMRPGDVCGTGTISGPTSDSFGSMLELSWSGQKQVQIAGGEERTFIEDGDEVVMQGWFRGYEGVTCGFGECRGLILPALTKE